MAKACLTAAFFLLMRGTAITCVFKVGGDVAAMLLNHFHASVHLLRQSLNRQAILPQRKVSAEDRL